MVIKLKMNVYIYIYVWGTIPWVKILYVRYFVFIFAYISDLWIRKKFAQMGWRHFSILFPQIFPSFATQFPWFSKSTHMFSMFFPYFTTDFRSFPPFNSGFSHIFPQFSPWTVDFPRFFPKFLGFAQAPGYNAAIPTTTRPSPSRICAASRSWRPTRERAVGI